MSARRSQSEILPIRGFLVHLTHYDPRWNARKARERPFDPEVAAEVVEAMAESGMNLLVIDIADAVKYRGYPELQRRYTVPMQRLRDLTKRAASAGLEVVPKLNFSQSHWHGHNDWFRPHHELFDNEEYWRRAFEVIDQVTHVTRPRRFFHIGMDEDHDRSYTLYAEAIQRLRDGLHERNLRAVMWNDSACMWPQAYIHLEKALFAEKRIARDIVQLVWDYRGTEPKIFRRLKRRGFELWGAPGSKPENAARCRDALLRIGGVGAIITQWVPLRPGQRKALLRTVRSCGAVLSAPAGTKPDEA
jgi:hypothetical protein